MSFPLTRRSFAAAVLAMSLWDGPALAQTRNAMQYPIRWPDRAPGDGFFIRHGFTTENTWYAPGWWHTGEDWYALDDAETGGAEVRAIADGQVVYANFDYPGRVVIIQHEEELFSCYGHLDFELDVVEGDTVASGDRLGTVLVQTDGRAPSHLHFEIRDFLTSIEVNGDAPRYGVNCGFQCPPGPGYWPIDAPGHPVEMGWLNPTSVIASRSSDVGEVVVAEGTPSAVDVRDAPDGNLVGEIELTAGQIFNRRMIESGDPKSHDSRAEAYRLWYEIELPDSEYGWISALVASDRDTGSDGRPSSIQFVLLPQD